MATATGLCVAVSVWQRGFSKAHGVRYWTTSLLGGQAWIYWQGGLADGRWKLSTALAWPALLCLCFIVLLVTEWGTSGPQGSDSRDPD